MISVYLDAANLDDLERYARDARVSGVTTNPSLLRKEGIKDYRKFSRAVLSIVKSKPVSFEVLADGFAEMERQAREIASWGKNVWVKIPVTNTRGESTVPVLERLGDVNLNITAVMTNEQVSEVCKCVKPQDIVSIFAGRIMDTGRLPPRCDVAPCQVLWASAREVYHVVLAEEYGYDIITLTSELIAKLDLRGKDLTEYSLDTVRQFACDGRGIEL